MRIDLVSIFPDYFAPLDLSLPGKAREKGLLEVAVHDLRSWTHDRHRTVDDTPYGGGAGMVMKPEPWGEALDELVRPGSTVVFTTPSGEPFTQGRARELATHEHLVFACGRYEGIDQRVLDHARQVAEVREISLGDYVLNGGEVAALAITEAVVRLLPGFMGNPDSLVEESHEDGLLEYPVYTKPSTWRGHEVPPVLLSGNHGAIATWRHEEAVRRTAARRPDLLSGATGLGELEIRPAVPADVGEVLTLQRAAFASLQRENPTVPVDELTETTADIRRWSEEGVTLVATSAGRLVGFAWGKSREERWRIARVGVAPDLQGSGVGRRLVSALEGLAPAGSRGFEVMTGAASKGNQRFYRRLGYRVRGEVAPGVVRMTKPL